MKVFMPLFLALAVAASPGFAQTEMRPGLWEYNIEYQSESGQMEAAMEQAREALESLPPEQREAMKEQLAAQGMGFDMQGISAQVCIDESRAADAQFPEPEENCEQEVLSQDDDSFRVRFRCEGDPPVEGEGEIRLLSETRYEGKVTLDTTVQDQAEHIEVNQSGRWLGAECAN